MNIHRKKYLPSERVGMDKKQLTWISFSIVCSIAALVSMEAMGTEGTI